MVAALVLAALLIALVVLVIRLFRRRPRPGLDPEIEAEYRRAGFTVASSWLHNGLSVSGTHRGTPFVLKVIPHTGAAIVGVPAALDTEFFLEREGSRDFSGGDLVESTFPDARARDAVLALFRLGFDSVALSGGRLSAARSYKGMLEGIVPGIGALCSVVEQLAVIRAMPGKLVEGPKSLSRPVKLALTVATPVLALGALALWLVAAKTTGPLAESLPLEAWLGTAAAFVALSVLAHRLLRGRPQAGVTLFAVVALYLPLLMAAAWGGAVLANEHLDEGAARERITVGGRPEQGSRSRRGRYFVRVHPLREGGPYLSVEVSPAYRNMKAGQRWIVRTRPGWLGLEWVESTRPAPER